MTRVRMPFVTRLRWTGGLTTDASSDSDADRASDRSWVIEDLTSQRRFAVPSPAADVVARLMADQSCRRDDLVALLRSRHGIAEDQAVRLLDMMTEVGAIVGDDGPSPAEQDARDLRRIWEAHGWASAAQFQIHTNDYPFLDYSRGGRATDLDRMAGYSAESPDRDRTKHYPDPLESVDLPVPRQLPDLGETSWAVPTHRGRAHLDELGPLLSLAFAKTGETAVPWTNSEPAYLRTSPSGGARHPVEAYLLNLAVQGLAPGWWHLRWDQPALDRLSGPISAAEAGRLLPGAVGRAPRPPVAALLFTIVFSRNMYRYREPRTFRALHMDAGHLIGMAELVLGSHGYRTFAHHWVAAEACSEALALDPLSEGCLSALSIAV